MPLNIPDLPLFVGVSVIPNVFIEMDDSGSMDWEVLTSEHWISCSYAPTPDNLTCNGFTISDQMYFPRTNSGNRLRLFDYYSDTNDQAYNTGCPGPGNQQFDQGEIRASVRACLAKGFNPFEFEWRFYSSDLNLMFFNPEIEYRPWVGFDDASFSAARSNPQPGTDGHSDIADLSGFEFAVWKDDKGFKGDSPSVDSGDMNDEPNGIVDLWDTHIRVRVENGGISCWRGTYVDDGDIPVRSETAISVVECAPYFNNQSLAELQQNIANWYQYNRRRSFAAKGAVVKVLNDIPNLRYGISLINEFNELFIEMPDPSATDFSAHNQMIVDGLLDHIWRPLGTPLRMGLQRVGQFYDAESNALDQGRDSPIIEACQKNFALLFTDGIWNGSEPGPIQDVDEDGTDSTLADVAREFYGLDPQGNLQRDLDENLENLVPTDNFDINNAQHMVTYTIAFGLSGALEDTDDDGWPDPPLGVSSPAWWESGNDGNAKRVDDLWHAAFNGRGRFISARRPEQVAEAVGEAIRDITSRSGTAAAASVNGGAISIESRVFQARFNSEDWHGDLFAFEVQSDGGLSNQPLWNAGELLTDRAPSYFQSQRVILARDPLTGTVVNFDWGSLSDEQRQFLDINPATGESDGLGELRLMAIRGVDLNDERIRQTVNKLGDLINSDPEFVGAPRPIFNFDNHPEFAEVHRNRRPMLYIGGNDGMLHAFDANTGEERFNFIPGEVFPGLNRLADPDYAHRFFVDGPQVYGDAQIGSNWLSVLAGTLRSGGQGVYALDVTNPESFTAGDVLWEFTDADDADLGLTFSRPQIVRMNNDKWAVIIGNGYNNTVDDGHASANGEAALFILFLEDGLNGFEAGDYVKIKTGTGTLENPNGLGSPGIADVDGDARADLIYAGDLQGNLWKFDVSSENPGGWGLAFSGQPLFTAVTEAGVAQPITAAPTAIPHPLGLNQGALIVAGTGKFIETADVNAAIQPEQTIYAIWDRDVSPNFNEGAHGFSRGQLAEIKLNTSGGFRFIDDDASEEVEWLAGGEPQDRGWFIDLPEAGERIVRETQVRSGVIFFTSLIPSQQPCIPGGTGFLMALDANTGREDPDTVFDTNDDNVFNDLDNPEDRQVIGLEQTGLPTKPVLLFDLRTRCERNPQAEGCGDPDDNTDTDNDGIVDRVDPFPPRLNAPRACGDGPRLHLYTTTSDGDIDEARSLMSQLNCGRFGWRQGR